MELGPNQRALMELWHTTTVGQATGQLRDANDCYCCLGLAANLAHPNKWAKILEEEFNTIIWGHDQEGLVMSSRVKDYFGFYTNDGSPDGLGDHRNLGSCAMMNDDHGYIFDEIADVVEAHPEAYFKESK